MAKRYIKDVLRAGTFRKGKDLIRVSDEDLKLAVLNFEKMQKNGYRVPVIIEHAKPDDPEGLPVHQSQVSVRDRAKYQAGWSDGLRITDDGVLQVAMDVKSDAGLNLVGQVGTYISPQFGPWIHPGEDTPSPMTITHFALTPYPVDIGQDPTFTEVPDIQPLEAIQLSHLVSFSMADMLQDDPATANRTDPDTDGDGTPDSPADTLADQMPDVPPNPQVYGQITEALKMLGVILPDSVSHADNPEALLAALMTAAHHTQKAEGEPPPDDTVPPPLPGQNPNLGPPGQDPRLQGTKQENTITMSQTATLKTLPEFVSMSQAVDVLAKENAVLKREKYISRIDGLIKTGRMTPAKAEGMKATVGTYQFSATTTSTEFVKLDAALEYAESLPEGAVWSPDQRVQQMSMTEHKQPGFFNDTGDNIDSTELVKELDRRFGVLAK